MEKENAAGRHEPDMRKAVLYVITHEEVLRFVEAVFERARQNAVEEKDVKEETVSRQEAADILGVDPSTLWRWDRDGYLRGIRVGRRILYRRSDIDAILRKE